MQATYVQRAWVSTAQSNKGSKMVGTNAMHMKWSLNHLSIMWSVHLCYDSRQHKQRAAIRMLRSRERASNLKVELAILLRMQSERHALPKVLHHAARREILLMSTALKIAASCGSLACLEDIMKIYASCAIPLSNLPQSNCSVNEWQMDEINMELHNTK